MSMKQLLINHGPATVTTTVNGDPVDVGAHQDFVGEIRCGTKTGGTSITLSFEDSFDGGTTWNTWFSVTGLTASDTAAVAAPTRPHGPHVRWKITEAGGGSWANVVARLAGNRIAG